MVMRDFNNPDVTNKEHFVLFVIMFQSGEFLEDKVYNLIRGFGRQFLKVDKGCNLTEEVFRV
jgi:V-type H+-transporting ATPase subunit a